MTVVSNEFFLYANCIWTLGYIGTPRRFLAYVPGSEVKLKLLPSKAIFSDEFAVKFYEKNLENVDKAAQIYDNAWA